MSTQTFTLENSLGYLIGRAGRAVGGLLNRNMSDAGYDVTCEQWSILFNLSQKNGQTQHELAANSCKDKTSMTRLIDNMEKHDLVVRIPDKQDKRQKLIYLTHKGSGLEKKLIFLVQDTIKAAEYGIDAKDIKLCKDVLCRIYNNLTEIKPKPNVAPATKKMKRKQ